MAGHSHWAGIKHKKGRADKERSKIFSKLSREITVAAKLGDKDPDMNHRLRSAIQAARSANMPKDNIDRAIDKSKFNDQSNFDEIRSEGFGIYKIANLSNLNFIKLSFIVIISFFSAIITIHFFYKWIEKFSFRIFSIYRVLLGLIILFYLI